jgi:hypothetical protein
MVDIPSAKDKYTHMGGFLLFSSIVLESSGLPLFELWSNPALANVTGVEHVTIIDFHNADFLPVQLDEGVVILPHTASFIFCL